MSKALSVNLALNVEYYTDSGSQLFTWRLLDITWLIHLFWVIKHILWSFQQTLRDIEQRVTYRLAVATIIIEIITDALIFGLKPRRRVLI